MKKNLLFLLVTIVLTFFITYIIDIIVASYNYAGESTSHIYTQWAFCFVIGIIIFLALKIYYAIKELNDKLEDITTNQN